MERNRRRSDRVSVSVPIQVSWTLITGRDFTEKARTLAISRYGATIALRQKLAPLQQIIIRSVGADKAATARVLGEIRASPDEYVYGVAFLEANPNLWNIEFPSLAEEEKAVSRPLLECSACHGREVAYLDELQTEVFEASRSISLPCKQCATWTVWKLALHGEASERGRSDRAPALAPRTVNERKHVRISVRLTGCIREPGFGEEIVQVENVSRGGFRFFSSRTYSAGSSIEVAVPYTPGAANVFVPARIIRFRELPRKRAKEYGVAYVRTHEHQP